MVDDDDGTAPPSKSERKRTAHAAQQLGEELIRLRDADLDALDLPERLTDAVRAARSITSRAGGARQRQYIGKLMREIDVEPIRTALAARGASTALQAQRFRRLEVWRERLISEGPDALQQLLQGHAHSDPAQWQRQVAAAIAERARGEASGAASRALFRALRALLEDAAPG